MTPYGRKNGMLMMGLGMINDLNYFGCLTSDEYLQIKNLLEAAKDRADVSFKEYILNMREDAAASTKKYVCALCSKPCYLYCKTDIDAHMSIPERCPVDGDSALWVIFDRQGGEQ